MLSLTLAPCSHDFSVLFGIVIISLGGDRADLYASRTLICLSCMCYFLSFCLFFLLSGVGCCL